MKILSKLSVIACLCWATLASCESPDYETGRTAQVNGLVSVSNGGIDHSPEDPD